jgi:hypothetical protein
LRFSDQNLCAFFIKLMRGTLPPISSSFSWKSQYLIMSKLSYPCNTSSRLTHFLDNRLTDGGEAVGLMRRPPFIPRKIPGTRFC